MMARGFKPVGWVAGVAAAALGCYMLSLNVAAERAELKKLEWRIIMAKRDIRTLQTELGTRGRLQQLESWNANVLALSAPTANQFVASEVTLARFDQREKTIEERVPLQMASAEAGRSLPAPEARIQAPVHYASVPASVAREPSLVHRASVVLPEAKPVAHPAAKAERKPAPAPAAAKAVAEAKPVTEPKKKLAEAKPAEPKKKLAEAKPAQPKKKSALIDDDLVKEIRAAAKAENKGSGGGQ
jgi:uncharacterized protein (DUF4415 family)